MDTRDLKTFITIVKTGNFINAAKKLDYAQSTITGQIRNLENELGTRLFERIGRKVHLTPQGKTLLDYAEKLIGISSEMTSLFTSNDHPCGVLRLAASGSLSRIPALLTKYHALFPDVEIALKCGYCSKYLASLCSNEIDVCILLDEPITSNEFIVTDSIKEIIGLYSSPLNLLTQKNQIEWKDIANQTLILNEPECNHRRFFEKRLEAEGVTPKHILEIDSIQMVKEFTLGNLGIAVLPEITVKEELIQGKLLPIKLPQFDFNFATQIIHHKDKWISPALQAFLDLARQEINHQNQ